MSCVPKDSRHCRRGERSSVRRSGGVCEVETAHCKTVLGAADHVAVTHLRKDARERRGRFGVERAVLVMRHGIRAPLDGEVPPERKPFRRLTYLDCKRVSALKRYI
jgi:hypothetical protein